MIDLIHNGQASGDVASRLLTNGFHPGALRPWYETVKLPDGREVPKCYPGTSQPISYCTNAEGKVVTTNTVASMRKDDWKLLDDAVLKAARSRLRAVADLRERGLVLNIPNGMAKTQLDWERETDITGATVSMDGMRESEKDGPGFDLKSLPLPIIHKDFEFSARYLAAARAGGTPLDTSTAEKAGRVVAEEAEKLLLGISSYQVSTSLLIQGYTNLTGRLTKVLTLPTASGWTGATLIRQLLEMREQLQAVNRYGPYMIYISKGWDIVMDQDYSTAKGDNTLRDRIRAIGDFEDVRTLDFLTGYQILMIQMTSDVVREVIGMDITTVQWESKGGMLLHYKVMAIMVPNLRADINGSGGIVHGTAA